MAPLSPEPPPRPAPIGPPEPVESAGRWLRDVVIRNELETAWPGTDPDYRLALIQAIIYLNEQHPELIGRDRDELARLLSREDPTHHPLWPLCALLLMEEFVQVLGEINLDTLRTAAPKRSDSAYRLVLFEHQSEPAIDQPPEMHSHGLLMHLRGERWVVAGLSERPAVPGWPPDLGY